MKYVAVFLTILLLGIAALALIQPDAAGGMAISHGEAVDFVSHLPAEGELVLFQFTADWCPGCRTIEPYVATLEDEFDFLTRRKVDIDTWESDASRQMYEMFNARSIPFFALYDSEGEAVAIGDFERIDHAVRTWTQ